MTSKSIHEILTDPESLAKLSNDELKTLLAPYIPEAHKALLPEGKASKIGLDRRLMKDFMNDPKIASQLAALRAAREKK